MKLVALLVALVLPIASEPPTTADLDPEWVGQACPVAELNAAVSDSATQGSLVTVTVPGLVDCTDSSSAPVPGARFAIVKFPPEEEFGWADENLMREYPRGGSFGFVANGTFNLDSAQPLFPYAVCLMTDAETRTSCVAVRAAGGSVFVTPLSTSDPSVAKPVLLAHSGPNPGCASCWRIW